MKAQLVKLGDIAEIRVGYPFRGAIEDEPEGSVRVVVMKHLDEVYGVDWNNLVKKTLPGRRSPDWLQTGDILFAARGNKNLAYYLADIPENVVCSPHFFQIRVKPNQNILSEFLAWQINQSPVQQYLAISSEGALIRNIRREVLESVSLVIPSIDRQKQLLQ